MSEAQKQTLLTKLRDLMGNRIMPDQRSTVEQLKDLIAVANALGMYDAADALQGLVQPKLG